MTVSSQTPYSSQAANGATTVFPFAYRIRNSGEIVVLLVDAEGNFTAQTLGVNYTVTGAGSPTGGSVNFTAAPAVGLTVQTYRATALERNTDYQNNGDLRAAVLNGDLDAIWLALQEMRAGTSLAPNVLRARFGESLDELPISALRASHFLTFDPDGQPEADITKAYVTDSLAFLLEHVSLMTTLNFPLDLGLVTDPVLTALYDLGSI